MSRWESDEERRARDEQWNAALTEDPDLADTFAKVSKAVAAGTITLAEAGGFTEDELDSAFAATTRLVETGKVGEALQMAGYLILLEPWRARTYLLAGVCFHRRRQYDLALQYFDVALAIDEDPITLLRKGETLLMLGERERAASCLREGIDGASSANPESAAHVARATELLATYLGGQP